MAYLAHDGLCVVHVVPHHRIQLALQFSNGALVFNQVPALRVRQRLQRYHLILQASHRRLQFRVLLQKNGAEFRGLG